MTVRSRTLTSAMSTAGTAAVPKNSTVATSPRHTKRSRHLSLGAGVLAGALLLTACGSSDHDMSTMPAAGSATSGRTAAGTPASGPHNDADVAFATGMIPHHAQAIEMADLAAQRASASEVKQLAASIKAEQGPEIQQLSGWLTGWGQPVPATDGSMAMDHSSGDHGGMAGMMSEQEMSQLAAATGEAFDTLWLQLMIRHHEGAVTMAQAEIAQGGNPVAKELAQTIMDTQQAEISTMKSLQTSS